VSVLFLVDVSAQAADVGRAGVRFYIYRDAASAENHGEWTNYMPNGDMIKLTLVDKDAAEGKTAAKAVITFASPYWCGLAVSCKPDYWGETPDNDSAYDLRNATKLVFSAKSDTGAAVQVKFGIAGDKPYGDSLRMPIATRWIKLEKEWTRYELPLRGDMHRIITPFCFVTNTAYNSGKKTIDVSFDEIYVQLGPER